jgi:hypothetical protein
MFFLLRKPLGACIIGEGEHMKRVTVLLLLVVLVVALGGCELLGQKEVRYEVTSDSGSTNIRYENEDGELISVYTTATSWSHSFTVNRVAAAIVAYVEAESTSALSSYVSVSISEDGFEEAFSSTTSAYAFAKTFWVIE